MRLQEVHPATVHAPITLLPLSLTADVLGRLTGNDGLLELGRRTMPLAAFGAAVAGLAGLVAQEASHVPEEAHPVLTTHRNLNLGLIGLTTLLAWRRRGRQRPTLGYLAVGFGALGTMAYSASLGGHLVYGHGVGVEPAGGTQEGAAPEIRADNLGEVSRLMVHHDVRGARHAWKHLEEGRIAPALTERGSPAAAP
jgi:uncharacterized membrane protein